MSAPWKQTAPKARAAGEGGGFEKAPPGNHPAVLVAIVDMGTQRQEYGGEEKWQRRAYFIWELVTEKMSGTKDRNHLIGIDLTVSLNEKAKLRQWIEARVGKKMPDEANYDISEELGKACLLSVMANAKGYPKVNGVAAMPKSLASAMPKAQNPAFLWSLDDYEKEGSVDLPDWVESQWLYGEKISAHIYRCKEITGAAEKESRKAKDATHDAELSEALFPGGRGVAAVDEEVIPF